jgi:hypothetical protein
MEHGVYHVLVPFVGAPLALVAFFVTAYLIHKSRESKPN